VSARKVKAHHQKRGRGSQDAGQNGKRQLFSTGRAYLLFFTYAIGFVRKIPVGRKLGPWQGREDCLGLFDKKSL